MNEKYGRIDWHKLFGDQNLPKGQRRTGLASEMCREVPQVYSSENKCSSLDRAISFIRARMKV